MKERKSNISDSQLIVNGLDSSFKDKDCQIGLEKQVYLIFKTHLKQCDFFNVEKKERGKQISGKFIF